MVFLIMFLQNETFEILAMFNNNMKFIIEAC